MASFEYEKRDYEKQLYAWLKASADRDGQALSSLSKVFMGTDGSSTARSASESDVVALLASAGYPLDVKLTYYSTKMVKQTTKPYIAHNVTVEGRTYKKIALMNGKGDASGVVYNVTLRWRKDLTPVYKWTTNKRGVSVLQGTRPLGKGAGYHYKYWYVPTSNKAALLDRCRKWADAIFEAYASKGVSGANIVIGDYQNDPLTIYRKNRSAMQRLKLKKTTKTEYPTSPSEASPSSSTASENMDAEARGNKRTREGDLTDNGTSYVGKMNIPVNSIPPYTPPSYEPITSVHVVPDSPVAPDYSPITEMFSPEHNSVPPMTQPHIEPRDAIDETLAYIDEHPSVLEQVPTLEWSHDALMHDPNNQELDAFTCHLHIETRCLHCREEYGGPGGHATKHCTTRDFAIEQYSNSLIPTKQ